MLSINVKDYRECTHGVDFPVRTYDDSYTVGLTDYEHHDLGKATFKYHVKDVSERKALVSISVYVYLNGFGGLRLVIPPRWEKIGYTALIVTDMLYSDMLHSIIHNGIRSSVLHQVGLMRDDVSERNESCISIISMMASSTNQYYLEEKFEFLLDEYWILKPDQLVIPFSVLCHTTREYDKHYILSNIPDEVLRKLIPLLAERNMCEEVIIAQSLIKQRSTTEDITKRFEL